MVIYIATRTMLVIHAMRTIHNCALTHFPYGLVATVACR